MPSSVRRSARRKGSPAEEANRAKDESLAILGHELRNPLSPIQTALEVMKIKCGPEVERERKVIGRQVSHLTRLVDDLLDVARISRGKVELRREHLEISEIVSKALELVSPLIEERAHQVTLDVPSTGLPLNVDPLRLTQVVSNLLSNAAKYTERRGAIRVAAWEAQEQVFLEVRDTGVGIAPETLPKVFDLFVQERQTLDRSRGGLGLGLTISRNLIESHGGTIRADSPGAGQGSTFTICLPMARHMPGATPQPSAHESSRVVASRRVLVVDDNEDGAEMLSAVLSALGHEVRIAFDGVAAMEAAREFIPDVAFLDIGLPVMDGYELAARMSKIPGLEELRLVALTGYGQESDRARSRAAGFHHHLVKPVDLVALNSVLAPR